MSRTIYHEKRVLLHRDTSLSYFIVVVMPILRVYIAAGEWRRTHYINDLHWEMTLGDEQNAHLKHSLFLWSQDDIYTGCNGDESFRGYQLIHPTTNEKLDVIICINRMVFTPDEIAIKFEGEAGEVENLRKAVQPVLQKYQFVITHS